AAAPPAAEAKPATGGAAQAAKPANGETLVIASIGPLPTNVHPYPDAASYSDTWSQIAGFIWGASLLDLDANTLEYIPYAASEFSVSPDGRMVTFKLRDDLKWSDGRPITVEDYIFAYEQASKEENNFVGLADLERIESFTAPDPRTIVVRLKETLARDLAIGAANSVSPVPRHVWEGKSWLDPVANPEILKPTVVSGPFALMDWNTAEGATFERNPNWFRGQPTIDRIVFRPGQQPTVAYELLRSNQAHWAPAIPPSQYTEAKQNPNLTMYEWNAANGLYRLVEFNLTRVVLKDKRVREALSRVLNRQDLIQIAENNLAQPQYTFLNTNNPKWYNPDVEKYEFDMNRAKALLQEAGFRLEGDRLLDPSGQPVRLQVLYPVSSNPRAKIATYMQQQYRQLGIDVEVRGLDPNAYFEEVQKMNYDISLGSWGGGSIDPDLSSKEQYLSEGQQNRTGFANERVDQLFQQGAVEQDEAKRKQIYDEIQKIVNDELPSLFLYSALTFTPMSKQVTGVQTTRLDSLNVNDAITRWQITE
ncbi:MAG: ABC transporter substrate-binding protein, partial [Chloroflexota bacterium]|nr:ABC transporter substrate-binding protein [Chloroflexota bacterium]